MKSRFRLAFTLISMIGSGVVVAALNANAQQPPQGAPPSPPGLEKHAPHMMFSPADRAAFFDAHLAALRVGLKLTPEQEKLWPSVEAALRAGAKNAMERHQKIQGGPHDADAIAWLRQISAEKTAEGETLKAIADAAAPLYATLSEEQKHRLPALVHGIKRHFAGHFGMMPEGMRGPHEGGEPGGIGSHEDGPYDEDEGHHRGWE
jgi:zinc resistance-associated protein